MIHTSMPTSEEKQTYFDLVNFFFNLVITDSNKSFCT